MSERIITSEAVLLPTPELKLFLDAYGWSYGKTVREVYGRCVIGSRPEPWFEAKNSQSVRVELTNRGWSQREATSIYQTATAAQSSAIECAKLNLLSAQEALEVVERKLAKAPTAQRHGLARRRDRLASTVARLTDQLENDGIRVCFGSRKALRATREWEANGFESQMDARMAWRRRRAGMIYIQGDSEEIAGNASLRVELSEDGDSVSIRVPAFLRHLTDGAERVSIPARGFAEKQGREQLAQTIVRSNRDFEWEAACWCRENARRDWQARVDAGDPEPGKEPKKPRATRPKPACSSPVTVRLSWNKKLGGWYVGATFTVTTDDPRGRWAGLLGVDTNPDHLAWAVVNRHGNPLAAGRIDLDLTGAAEQNRDNIGVAVRELFRVRSEWEARLGGVVPVIRERLDFARARRDLRYLPRRLSWTLSSFAYNRIIQTMDSRGAREGAIVRGVNPAYTSILGWANYASTYGFSVDQAAAVCIARRGLGLQNSLRPAVQGRLAEDLSSGKKKAGRARSTASDCVPSHQRLLREASKRLSAEGRKATYQGNGLVRRRTSASNASCSSVPGLGGIPAEVFPVISANRGAGATLTQRASVNAEAVSAGETADEHCNHCFGVNGSAHRLEHI